MVKRKSGVGRWVKVVLAVALPLALFSGAIYAAFYSGFFRVRDIEVRGADISAADILAGREFANILLPFPAIDVAEFPEILSFTVNKDYWNRKVVIEVKGREPTMIWCLEQSNRCFWTDPEGFIFSDAPQPSGSGVVRTVEDISGRDLGVGNYALSQDEFTNLLSGLNVLDGLRVPVSGVRIDNVRFEEFTVVTADGPKIYFSLLFNPEEDYDALKSLVQSDGWKGLCYVDLRTELRVYTSKVCR